MAETWSGNCDAAETVAHGETRSHAGPGDEGGQRQGLSPGQTLDRYVVLEQIGVGGMGEVVRAYDPRLRREIALKRLRSRTVDELGEARLVREARAMAALSHPNVVAIYDVAVGSEGVTLAMEYVPGRTLREWIAERGRSWQEVRPIFAGAGAALAAAHRAGLVHRDFKPANVLLGSDGVVKVTDFGLAKRPVMPSSDGLGTVSVETAVDDTELTRADTVVGSPAYMAPEQHEGPADARADQFAFCVSLWEALAGQRPFTGRLEELREAKRRGPPVWPAAGVAPRKVIEALRRGLAPSPEDRWPDMEALLARLDSSDARRRRGIAGVGAVAVVSIFALVASESLRNSPCSGADDKMSLVWSSTRADEVDRVLHQTNTPYAAGVSRVLRAELDAYADAWRRQFTEACEATTVRGEQSQIVMDRRMACLERSRMRLDEAVKVLLHADADVVAHAHEIAESLPRLNRCENLDALEQEVPPPEDPTVAQAVRDAERILARAAALRDGGKHDEALQSLAELAGDRAAIDHPPLWAGVDVLRSKLLDDLGRFDDAVEPGQRALREALAMGQWELAFDAAANLARVQGRRLDRFELADAYLDTARGLVRRPQLGPLHVASLELLRGELFMARGEFQAAAHALDRALELRERELDPGDQALLSVRQTRADLLVKLDRLDEALSEHRRVVEALQEKLGKNHPTVGTSLNNLAVGYVAAGRYEEADAALLEVIEVHEKTIGAEHPFAGFARDNRAFVLRKLDRLEDAEAEHRRALAIIAGALGEDHRDVGTARDNLGQVLTDLGRFDEAEEQHRKALEVFEKALGTAHPDTLQCRRLLADLLVRRGRVDEAMELHRFALDVLGRAAETPPEAVALTRLRLGSLLLTQEDPRALPHLERAWDFFEGADGARLGSRVAAAFALARAAQAEEPERAVQLAQTARDLAATASHLQERVEEIETWLDEHAG